MNQNTEAEGLMRLAYESAMAAAREAGAYLITKQRHVQVLYKKALRDDLLDADLEAEAIILNILRLSFPTFDIFSEEAEEENGKTQCQWIVDPLDGSANFQHGSPLFAISISLIVNKTSVLGIVYLPALNEMFTAIHGRGAALNGHTIHVSRTSLLNEAIVHMGDFAKNGNVDANRHRTATITRLANEVGRVRMIGTAATDLAYLACGRADALIMYSNHPWDVEAGSLILEEAGGTGSILGGAKAMFIYSNGHIHHQLIERLARSE